MMRVLLPTPDYPPMSGGIQILLDRLVSHSRHRYEVVTLGAAAGTAPCVTEEGVVRVSRRAGHRVSVALLNAATLARAMRWQPDVVLSGHIVTGPAGLAVRRIRGTPLVQYLYSAELADRPRLTRVLTRRADASIAVSSHARRQAIVLGGAAERVHVVLPGVDFPPGPVPRRSSSRTAPTIVTVARLEDRYKGFDVMMRAMPLIRERSPDARWVVVGEGSLRSELEALARAEGVADWVTFTGSVADEARDAWLDKSDVFVMPSRLVPGSLGGEGFGIVYLEAGAHGLPCVAANVGGSTDAVLDGETGLLVDPTSHTAVADAIVTLLLDHELRSRLGEAGRAYAKRLSWGRMAEEVDALIEGIATGSR